MKKILTMLLVGTLGVAATAQEITPYSQYKINEGVSVEVKELNRVEKYGWDNFEITYRLINDTEFDLFKVDLTLYLVGKNDEQVGMIEIHDFKVPKNSDSEYHYVDLHSPYVNEKYEKIIVVKNSIEVLLESPSDTDLAKIACEPSFSYK